MDKTTENTTDEEKSTRMTKESEDRTRESDSEKATKTKRKKMNVAQENLPFGHAYNDIAHHM
jgi:hypothetical protein